MKGHKIINQEGLHFVTFTIVGWIDVFTRKKYCEMVLDSFRYCVKHKGLVINAYVIMSNHIHLIAYAKGAQGLSDIIRDFKSYTSKNIIKDIANNKQESRRKWMIKLFKQYGSLNGNNSKYQFWQRHNKPTELISPKWINIRLNYIHQNPVKAGYVNSPEHFRFSSASNYLNGKGEIDIEVIDLSLNIGYIFH